MNPRNGEKQKNTFQNFVNTNPFRFLRKADS